MNEILTTIGVIVVFSCIYAFVKWLFEEPEIDHENEGYLLIAAYFFNILKYKVREKRVGSSCLSALTSRRLGQHDQSTGTLRRTRFRSINTSFKFKYFPSTVHKI